MADGPSIPDLPAEYFMREYLLYRDHQPTLYNALLDGQAEEMARGGFTSLVEGDLIPVTDHASQQLAKRCADLNDMFLASATTDGTGANNGATGGGEASRDPTATKTLHIPLTDFLEFTQLFHQLARDTATAATLDGRTQGADTYPSHRAEAAGHETPNTGPLPPSHLPMAKHRQQGHSQQQGQQQQQLQGYWKYRNGQDQSAHRQSHQGPIREAGKPFASTQPLQRKPGDDQSPYRAQLPANEPSPPQARHQALAAPLPTAAEAAAGTAATSAAADLAQVYTQYLTTLNTILSRLRSIMAAHAPVLNHAGSAKEELAALEGLILGAIGKTKARSLHATYGAITPGGGGNGAAAAAVHGTAAVQNSATTAAAESTRMAAGSLAVAQGQEREENDVDLAAWVDMEALAGNLREGNDTMEGLEGSG